MNLAVLVRCLTRKKRTRNAVYLPCFTPDFPAWSRPTSSSPTQHRSIAASHVAALQPGASAKPATNNNSRRSVLAQLPANMRSPPPDVLASWPTPNYINPETRGLALIVVEILALCISTIFLGLRMYVRVGIMRSVDWDDWLMVAGAVCPPRIRRT